MPSTCLGGGYYAAGEDGEILCDHRHMRRAEADACADAIAAGEPDAAMWQHIASDPLEAERRSAALGIAIDLWQGLLDRIDHPTPDPGA